MTAHGHTRCSATPMTPSPSTGTAPVAMATRRSEAITVRCQPTHGNVAGSRLTDQFTNMTVRHSWSRFRVADSGAECPTTTWGEPELRAVAGLWNGQATDNADRISSRPQGGRGVAQRPPWNTVWAHPWPGATAGGTRRGWEW